jgi:DNA polymerase III delta prime subunit
MGQAPGKFSLLGLKRQSFTPEPGIDFVYFVKEELRKSVVKEVRRSLVLGMSPRIVIEGKWGIGKTQLLQCVKNDLMEEKAAHAIYFEAPALHRRSRLHEVLGVGLEAMAQDFVLGLLERAFHEAKAAGSDLSVTLGIPANIASAITSAIQNQLKYELWKWLKGQKLSSSELRELGLTEAVIPEDTLVAILNAIGTLTKRYVGKPLVFLIDECEHLQPLTGDYFSLFVAGLRGLLGEGGNVGVVFAISGKLEEVRVFAQPFILRRLSAKILMPEYSLDDATEFVAEAANYARAEDYKERMRIAGRNCDEKLSDKFYPFSDKAVQVIVDKAVAKADAEQMKGPRPKDILFFMDNSLAEIMLANKEYYAIESGIVERASKATQPSF